MSHQPFDPNNLPELPTAVHDVNGTRIGTFNPHTLIIHPVGDVAYGPLKLLGRMVFDMRGKMVGKFTTAGYFNPNKSDQHAMI
ncbi:MAG: hypothetical protein ACFE0Q_12565 [Anaerolineae bacterium]